MAALTAVTGTSPTGGVGSVRHTSKSAAVSGPGYVRRMLRSCRGGGGPPPAVSLPDRPGRGDGSRAVLEVARSAAEAEAATSALQATVTGTATPLQPRRSQPAATSPPLWQGTATTAASAALFGDNGVLAAHDWHCSGGRKRPPPPLLVAAAADSGSVTAAPSVRVAKSSRCGFAYIPASSRAGWWRGARRGVISTARDGASKHCYLNGDDTQARPISRPCPRTITRRRIFEYAHATNSHAAA